MEGERQERVFSRLESLPGQLRNRIYRYAVVEDRPVIAARVSGRGPWQPRLWRFTQPALASASKKIRHEVLSIFYAANSFAFGRFEQKESSQWNENFTKRVRKWLKSVGDDYASTIQAMGAAYCSAISMEDRTIYRVEGAIMATVTNGKCPSFYLCGGLVGQCECELRAIEEYYKLRSTPSRYKISTLFNCYYLFGRYGRYKRACRNCGKRFGWH